ncbi:MAG: tetratricopeptide repeat protein [Chromatiales bacterium]|jgi:regulator of sirC expression with transglutaminase-like and TPR domain
MPQPFDRLRTLAQSPDPDPAEASLELARLFVPDLDVAAWLERLDSHADGVRSALRPGSAASDVAAGIRLYLFGRLGLKGDEKSFYDPRNSFLNEVLERRLGIPISLSVAYLALARRLGLQAAGIGFPSHFLVQVRDERGLHVIDPFQGGRELSPAELNTRLQQVYGDGAPTVEARPALLRPAGVREILIRMLRNLKGVYQKRGDSLDALTAIEAILALAPDLVEEVGDRGLVYRELGNTSAAAQDLRRYMEATPDAREAAKLQELLDELEQSPTRLH